MTPRKSKFRNEHYPNLYRLPGQPAWIFRKWSNEKRKQFYCSTGLDAIDRNAPAAYRAGLEKFNEWVGAFTPVEASSTIRDLGRKLLAQKDDPTLSDFTYRATRNQIENHIIPAAGHMKPAQVTREWWLNYQREERKRPRQLTLKNGRVKELAPRTALFNTRKAMIEILNLAKAAKLIEAVPEFPLYDPESAPPREIPKQDILRIIRFAGQIAAHKHKGKMIGVCRRRRVPTKLLVYLMWKQGARPNEVLQYRWDMIRFDAGQCGEIDIPGLITKNKTARTIPLNPGVSRILRFIQTRKNSPWLFPSPVKPGERIKDYDSAWNTVTARLGLDYDIYNLRDTFITRKLEEGFSSVFIGKYVQNSAAMIEKRYAVAKRSIMEGVAR